MCHNEMSRDHDAPVEYLRKLASLKLRFGLAALGTAHGALPVVYPIIPLDTQLPNHPVGRQASQLRLRSVHRPSQQLGASMFWVTPPIVSLIAGRLPTTWQSSGAVQVVAPIHPHQYRWCSRVTPIHPTEKAASQQSCPLHGANPS